MSKKGTTTEEQNEALIYENPHILRDQAEDKFDDEQQKEEADKGGKRDLLAEALEKWETFKAKDSGLSGSDDQQ